MMKKDVFKTIKEVTVNECYMGIKNCHTCMYRDNERTRQGFRLDPLESGQPDVCRACRR